jgi:hypothetical protein
MNRLASLRLTERCADILISVREEIVDAGNTVADELHAPIAKLNECDYKLRVLRKVLTGLPTEPLKVFSISSPS